MKVSIRKPKEIVNGVRLYTTVTSRTERGKQYDVVHIRTATQNYWTCTCKDYVMREQGKNRHCDHIRAVRERIE